MKTATIVIYTILTVFIWGVVIGFIVYDPQTHRVKYQEFFTVSQDGVGETCASPGIDGCYDFSYVDQTGNIISNVTAKIASPNYYIDNSKLLQPVPYGFTADSNDVTLLIPITKIATYDVSANSANSAYSNTSGIYPNYNANLDNSPTYHDDYINSDGTSNGIIAPDSGGLLSGQMWAKDGSGNLINVSIFDSNYNNPLYYDVNSVPYSNYGPREYVPSYDDSVYLSSSLNPKPQLKPQPLAPVTEGSGFCTQYANNHAVLQAKCNETDPEVCASMSCCSLLGGEKCVASSKYGPLSSTSYDDDDLTNRDFYYYRGKCYGFCP